MNSPQTTIDISNKPELLRLAEEVNATKQPRILKRDSEAIAILMPAGTALKKRTTHRAKTKADYVCFASIRFRHCQIILPLFEREWQSLKWTLRRNSLPKVPFAAKTLPKDFSVFSERGQP